MVLSEKAVESIYCRAELEYAIALNKPVLPVMLKTCKFPDALNKRNTQYQDLTNDLPMDKVVLRVTLGLNQVERDERTGKYSPRSAERPSVPHAKAADDLTEVYVQAVDAMESGNDSLAEMLFQQVIEAEPDGLGEFAQEWLEKLKNFRKQKVEYQKVKRLAANKSTLRDAQTMARKYVQAFGRGYDPDGVLEGLIAVPTPSASLLTPQPPLQKIREGEQTRVEVVPPQMEDKPIAKLSQTFVPPDVSKILPPPFEWCEIPTGKVTLEAGEYLQEPTICEVERFWIAKYPITNEQYEVFVQAKDGYADNKWWDYSEAAKAWRQLTPYSQEPNELWLNDAPRTNVSWYEAVAFGRWVTWKVYLEGTLNSLLLHSNRTPIVITLPTEQQWHRAAQGDDGRKYPWGNDFDKEKYNTTESGIGTVTSVKKYPHGVSAFDVWDMAGNVREWCLTDWNTGEQVVEQVKGGTTCTLRGSSWKNSYSGAQCSSRSGYYPDVRLDRIGFRVVAIPV